MDTWTALLIVLAVAALAATLAGLLRDRRLTRVRRQALITPPDRQIPGFAAHEVVPQYLSQLEARTPAGNGLAQSLPEAELAALAEHLEGAASISGGWASEAFISDPQRRWAVVSDPVVVVCADPITQLRELFPVLELAMPRNKPVVLVASDISPDVLDVLEVNHLRGNLVAVVVLVEGTELTRAAESVGAALVPRHDLVAGWLPPELVGSCSWWVSGEHRCWVLDGGVGPVVRPVEPQA